MLYELKVYHDGVQTLHKTFSDRQQFITYWYRHNVPECYPSAIINGKTLTIGKMLKFIANTRQPGENYRIKTKVVT